MTTPSAMTSTAAHRAETGLNQDTPMIALEGLRFSYGQREALKGVSFQVAQGEMFGLLGPNGSGKSTLFRILATQFNPTGGQAQVGGYNTQANAAQVRNLLGVVFQNPGLDIRLTVAENLRFQGLLYGLSGKLLAGRMEELLARFGLEDRRKDLVGALSGGLKRRVELAKTLLHRPRLLLLDEPSTGLDPAARLELWDVLGGLRAQEGLTILVATHLMDEAERCHRLALIDKGTLVCQGTPTALKKEVGGQVLTLDVEEPETMVKALSQEMGLKAVLNGGMVRLEVKEGLAEAKRLMERYGGRIRSLTLGHPTLEDVFLDKTGHRLYGREGGEG